MNSRLKIYVLLLGSLIGALLSLYLLSTWETKGVCLSCAYEHLDEGQPYLGELAEYHLSTIWSTSVPLLTVIVFLAVFILAIAALTSKINAKHFSMGATALLLPSAAYGSYLQYALYVAYGSYTRYAPYFLSSLHLLYGLLYLTLIFSFAVSLALLISSHREGSPLAGSASA